MKRLTAYCLLFLSASAVQAQFYLRGSVRNEKNDPLQKALIVLHSSGAQSTTAADGGFSLVGAHLFDSITVTLNGFESQSLKVKADLWQNIILKMSPEAIFKNRPKLISLTKDKKRTARFNPITSDETYFKLVENEFVKAAEYPNTAFSLNVNKAAYSNVRRFINMQSRVPPDAVRVEELVNYFNLGYTAPIGKDNVFNIGSTLTGCPWNRENQLLFLTISAKKLDLQKMPPGNFVFLIDVSGSMDMPNRLPLLKAAFQLFIKNLRAADKVSIVTYGGSVGIWMQPTAGNEHEKISRSIEVLTAAGDTPGSSAIESAYKLAVQNFIPGGNNRVILATDGDFNVGQVSEKALDELISRQRQTGVYLTCLGVGMGNFKDSKLQTLAKRGNGNYAYLDDLHEAEKVMVHEITETLYAVADDAFINVEFDPHQVASYRLIGFDNKKEAVQDWSSDLDGGEIGSGSSTMAIFEIVPVFPKVTAEDFGRLSLKYHNVADSVSILREAAYCIPTTFISYDSTDKCLQFAAAVTLYGMMLKGSPFVNKASWALVKTTAVQGADKAAFLQNDFIEMLNKTIEVYEPRKKKKIGRRKKAKSPAA